MTACITDDALAAVVAAAQLMVANGAPDAVAQPVMGSRWALAGRLRGADADALRAIASAPSRWASSRRRRD